MSIGTLFTYFVFYVMKLSGYMFGVIG